MSMPTPGDVYGDKRAPIKKPRPYLLSDNLSNKPLKGDPRLTDLRRTLLEQENNK